MIETQMHPVMNETDPYLEQFERFEQPGAGNQPQWVYAIRQAGMARFAELGFPTLKDEDWRFTNVAPIAKLPFQPIFDAGTDGVRAKTLSQFTFSELSGARLVFVNGHFVKEFSTVGPLPTGVKAGSLATALVSDPAFPEKHLGRYVGTEKNAF